jgi:hypothetical protein
VRRFWPHGWSQSANLTVSARTTIRWENGGLASLTATSNTGLWDSGNLTPAYMAGGYLYSGGAYQRSFATVPATLSPRNGD